MQLEIVTPEKVILSAQVTSVAVPGVEGEFQMLENHAPIVSVLEEGKVKIDAGNLVLDEEVNALFTKGQDGRLEFMIKGGVLEFSNNKAIVLAD